MNYLEPFVFNHNTTLYIYIFIDTQSRFLLTPQSLCKRDSDFEYHSRNMHDSLGVTYLSNHKSGSYSIVCVGQEREEGRGMWGGSS